MNSSQIKKFRRTVYSYYKKHRRDFAWRRIRRPYDIVVSEIMLQQTQTERVAKKFPEFIRTFPSFQALAAAPFTDVMRVWEGMGYNRRARYLHDIARRVVNEYNGRLPRDPAILETFPGIGKNTAASIVAFAFNQPTVFIETNIRSVFINFFFKNRKKISDAEIEPLIAKTLDDKNPREWCYALMDYGAMLKDAMPNPNRKSAHYAKQSRFEGSHRQLRGRILRALLEKKALSETALNKLLAERLERTKRAIGELHKEGMVRKKENVIYLMIKYETFKTNVWSRCNYGRSAFFGCRLCAG
jgi:A/G-specific adenine glycosylase